MCYVLFVMWEIVDFRSRFFKFTKVIFGGIGWGRQWSGCPMLNFREVFIMFIYSLVDFSALGTGVWVRLAMGFRSGCLVLKIGAELS